MSSSGCWNPAPFSRHFAPRLTTVDMPSAGAVFLHQPPSPALLGSDLEPRSAMASLDVVACVFLTDVTLNIVVALAISVALVAAHGVVRRTDDLPADVFDEEAVGTRIETRYARMRLKEVASSSFSST